MSNTCKKTLAIRVATLLSFTVAVVGFICLVIFMFNLPGFLEKNSARIDGSDLSGFFNIFIALAYVILFIVGLLIIGSIITAIWVVYAIGYAIKALVNKVRSKHNKNAEYGDSDEEYGGSYEEYGGYDEYL